LTLKSYTLIPYEKRAPIKTRAQCCGAMLRALGLHCSVPLHPQQLTWCALRRRRSVLIGSWLVVTLLSWGCGGSGSNSAPVITPPVITPGWTWLQDTNQLTTGTAACSSSSTTCSILSVPTTAGSVWIAYWGSNASTSQIKITGVCSDVAPNSCTTTNNGWTLVPSSACAGFISGQLQIDCAYTVSGSSGQSDHTITVSAAPNSGGAFAGFVELLPPAGYTASFDVAGTDTNGGNTCSSCSAVNLGSLGGTDAIFQFDDFTNNFSSPPLFNVWSPYITDWVGNGISLNATSGAAPGPLSQGPAGYWVTGAIAFKSSAGQFTGPTRNYSLVNIYEPQTTQGCTPTCTWTIPTPTAGNLLFVEAASIDTIHISSATLGPGNSLTVPSGCETAISNVAADIQSCAYIVVPNSPSSSLAVTMSGSGVTGIVAYEVHRNTGTWALDAVGATANIVPTALGFMNGQSLASGCSGCSNAITGTDDVIFQGIFDPGGAWAISLYPMPFLDTPNGNEFLATNASSVVLLDTANGTAPIWTSSNGNPYVSVIAAAFK